MKNTTPRGNAELIQMLTLRETEGAAATAKHFGISPDNLRGVLRMARGKGLKPDPSKIKDETAKLKTKVANLSAELAQITRDNVTAADVREKIYGLATQTPSPPTWLHTAKAGKSSGVPLAMWSDFHWGERVFPDQVGGVNTFNRAIAKARFAKLVHDTIDLCKKHMLPAGTDPFEGIVIVLGGDMITGVIHDELRETNEGPIQVTLLEVQEQLIAGLTLIADEFGKVFVPCVVGNHGRMTLKPRAKNRVFDSYEWNLYCQLERHFRNDKRIQFLIPSEADAHFAIAGHRFMLTHGDALGVKGGDGIIGALGPIARGTIKVGRAEAQVGRDFDTLLIGHWHSLIPRGEACPVIVNGALKGYDEYAKLYLRARYSRPSQYLGFVHPKYGVTAQWPVYLDTQRSTAKTRNAKWISWEERA